jgi:hypothetical protein
MSKRTKVAINKSLRIAVWDRYVGPGVKKTMCNLCGRQEISVNSNSGFECAHIVAESCNAETTLFYLYPSCAVCNNECSTQTLFDYLFGRQRIKVLRRLIWDIYSMFEEHYPNELDRVERLAWKLLEHLYGPTKFPSGGGIVNRVQIYEIARSVQAQMLVARMSEISDELSATTAHYRRVCDSVITTGAPFI